MSGDFHTLGESSMAVPANQFWGSNHYLHPQLTDGMVAEAEHQLGVQLPPEYLTLLRIQNGGYTQGFGFPMSRPTIWAADHVPWTSCSAL